MPGSLLLTIALSAVALSVPGALGLLRMHRPSHAAPRATVMRRHAGLPAAVVGLGGALCAGAQGAGWVGAGVAALSLTAAVVVQARRTPSWLLPGVVTWAMVVTATLAGLAWLALQVVDVGDATATVGGAVAWLLLTVAVTRIGPYARGRVALRSQRDRQSVDQEAATPPPLGWLVTGAASVSLVLAFAVGAAVAPDEEPSQAADEDASSGGGEVLPPTPLPSSSPVPEGHAATPSAGGTSGARTREEESVTPAPEPTATTDATESTTPTPTPTPTPEPTKTPGYAKDKPNRPSDAPTPGSGRGGSS